MLFEHEYNMTARDGVTTLMLAAKYGGDQFFEQLATQRGMRDADGRSAIHYAAEAGQLRCVEYLVQYEV